MSLLDSILGMALNQGGSRDEGGMLGAGQGGALLNVVLGMLANKGGAADGAAGGLGELLSKFQQSGLGEVASSWVGKGENMPISADQLQSVLGSGTIAAIAVQLGLAPADIASKLSQLLPEVVDRVTPQGEVPQSGLGDIGELLKQFTGR